MMMRWIARKRSNTPTSCSSTAYASERTRPGVAAITTTTHISTRSAFAIPETRETEHNAPRMSFSTDVGAAISVPKVRPPCTPA